MRRIKVIAHNLRSAHNVGSLIRTCEGLGVQEVYLTGYTPYPRQPNDKRLPHLSKKISDQIDKTALGADRSITVRHADSIDKVISGLKEEAYRVVALEQDSRATLLPGYKPPQKLALIIGREVEGIEPEVLNLCDQIIEIPMQGKKESFNVVQAAAMALYHCQFYS